MRVTTALLLSASFFLSACGGAFIGDTSQNDAFQLQIPQSTVDLLYGPGATADQSPSLLD
ncbi:hypothetical protein [Nereida sp. MMG025]|uniref:hypothetical protein n=1 Tax=Nereida sp. MMG025 TaxID=2909981 RepID=UPI001F3C22F5|nr:hypothetical protein [Nereida sp. MMG025]MCF6444096.1 hypothetical protein [Nereida sp. MMG025]